MYKIQFIQLSSQNYILNSSNANKLLLCFQNILRNTMLIYCIYKSSNNSVGKSRCHVNKRITYAGYCFYNIISLTILNYVI